MSQLPRYRVEFEDGFKDYMDKMKEGYDECLWNRGFNECNKPLPEGWNVTDGNYTVREMYKQYYLMNNGKDTWEPIEKGWLKVLAYRKLGCESFEECKDKSEQEICDAMDEIKKGNR